MLWYCWDLKVHVPWLQGIYRIIGDRSKLPNNARWGVCSSTSWKEIPLQGVRAPRRINLTWADIPGERRASSTLTSGSFFREWDYKEHSGLFVGQDGQAQRQRLTWPIYQGRWRTKWPWRAEGLRSQLPTPPSLALTGASTTSCPSAKEQWISWLCSAHPLLNGRFYRNIPH